MTKTMIAVAVLMLASVATAARTSMLVTFSSPGPDTYADNSAVADGECYALVWTDDAANFAMADDGTVTGGKVAATVPAAEGGRCPVVKIHFDAEAAAEYADGTWGLYLLDTRGSAAGERTVSGAKLVANATIEVAAERFLKHSTLRSGMFLAAAGNYNVATEADLRAALAEGGNITLDADIAIGLELVVSNSVTLNLGTHTITVTAGNAIQVAANGNLVVEGTTGGIKADSGYAIFADYELSPGVKTITVNGGVIDGAVQFNKYPLYDSAGTVQSGEAAVPTTIVVNGGTFKGHIGVYHCPFTVNGGTFEQGLDTSDGSVSIYANYKCPVTITGGQFKMEPVGAGNRIIVGDGYYHDGYFVVGDTSACQAVRNGKLYLTLAEALETVGPNTTVSLKEGASFSGDPINVVLAVGQSLTFPNSLLGTAILVSGVGGTEIEKSYGVGATTYFVKTTDAARIGGTPYTTLDDAFAVVQDGETITVLKDCTLNTASLSALGCAATLDLNAHAVAVSGETADLSSAQLTIQGMGVLSGFAKPTAGRTNLIIKGGTYSFDPTSFVLAQVVALRDEQDSIDWHKERQYVFKDRAFTGVGSWSEIPGVWSVVPVPRAYVSRIDTPPETLEGTLDVAYSFSAFNKENGDSAIADKVIDASGLDISKLTDPAEIARAITVLSEALPFLGWHADFAVSFDGDIDANSLVLAGQYDGWSSSWVAYSASRPVSGGIVRRLLVDEGGASTDDWDYEHICTKVKVFNCGSLKKSDSLNGITMKVQLRLYAPETDEGTGSPSICVCEYRYSFGDYAAKIVRGGVRNFYGTMQAAIDDVQSNEVIIVANDYDGTATGSDKPFVVDVNGCAFTGTVTAQTDWAFEPMSNGNWAYHPKPPAAITVEVVEEGGASSSLATLPESESLEKWIDENVGSGESAAEVLNQTADNGLKNWENYVLGIDPTVAVRVDDEQAPVEATPVYNTLSVDVPADSGFTVKYELNKVAASGDLIEEGEKKEDATSFNLDLTQVTSNAFYRMAAVIESEDGTAAAKVVSSENMIGVLKVDSTSEMTLLAVPWASLSDGGEISVSNLVRTATLKEGDELYAYDPDAGEEGAYRAWQIVDGAWQPILSATSGSVEASDMTVKRGSAVWLKRQNPDESPIYLVGESVPLNTAETPLEKADEENKNPDGTVKETWNLVASPSVDPVDITEVLGDNVADKAVVPSDTVPKVFTYENGAWGYSTTEPVLDEKGVQIGVRPVRNVADTTVPAGTGFWYLNSKTDGEKSIKW